jgi:hypothetical protein
VDLHLMPNTPTTGVKMNHKTSTSSGNAGTLVGKKNSAASTAAQYSGFQRGVEDENRVALNA